MKSKHLYTFLNLAPLVITNPHPLSTDRNQKTDKVFEDTEFITEELGEDMENAENSFLSQVPATSTTLSPPNSTASKRKKKSDAVDNHIHQILEMVGDVTKSLADEPHNRHKDFCNYLGQRMSALPMKVEGDLEAEFTSRVNELLDIHTDE